MTEAEPVGSPWLQRLGAAFGTDADGGFGPPTVDVPVERWLEAAQIASGELGCTFFDFLTGVDELEDGFGVVMHLAAPTIGRVDSVLVRTRVPRSAGTIPCVCAVYAGAG